LSRFAKRSAFAALFAGSLAPGAYALSTMDIDGPNAIMPSCAVQAANDAACATITARGPDFCLDGDRLREEVVKNNGVIQPAGTCVAGAPFASVFVSCNAVCMDMGFESGACSTAQIDCSGNKMNAGYCLCGD
jgi:hypothetical protein